MGSRSRWSAARGGRWTGDGEGRWRSIFFNLLLLFAFANKNMLKLLCILENKSYFFK